MLPGFRFLFAAIVFSSSMLVFGLGAGALLHAAHQEFVSTPSWRTAPESRFAQQTEADRPVLAMLHIEPADTEQKPPENPTTAAEPETIAALPGEPERTAAPKQEPPSPETAKPDIPAAAESLPPANAAPAPADASAAVEEAKTAPAEAVSPPANETIAAVAAPDATIASTKVATLGGPPVVTETEPPAKAARAGPERSSSEKRLRVRQARADHRHRRIAQRARAVARQAPQQPPNPFSAPIPAVGGG